MKRHRKQGQNGKQERDELPERDVCMGYERRLRFEHPLREQNELTKRLLAEGYRLDMNSYELPENVWKDSTNFMYKAEWRFVPVWESPCGLIVKAFGDLWTTENGFYADGVQHCYENGNACFECPIAGPCEHKRYDMPPQKNCQFHLTEKANDGSYQREMKKKKERTKFSFTVAGEKGANCLCMNAENTTGANGEKRTGFRYDVEKCIKFKCKNTECEARRGQRRNTEKVNIFYDVRITRKWKDGFIDREETKVVKGAKAFPDPVARTDAEISLKQWMKGIYSSAFSLDRIISFSHVGYRRNEAFFADFHQKGPNGEEEYSVVFEVENIRIEKRETRDIMEDLQAVREGIEVIHLNDQIEEEKQKKRDEKKQRKIDKHLKYWKNAYLNNQKEFKRMMKDKWMIEEDIRGDLVRQFEEWKEKTDSRKNEKNGSGMIQMSMFDEEGVDA